LHLPCSGCRAPHHTCLYLPCARRGRRRRRRHWQRSEKILQIDRNLDDIQGELEISRKLITRFVKRIYTDKVRGWLGPARAVRRWWGRASGGRTLGGEETQILLLLPAHARVSLCRSSSHHCLLFLGILGIIIYASVHPVQQTTPADSQRRIASRRQRDSSARAPETTKI